MEMDSLIARVHLPQLFPRVQEDEQGVWVHCGVQYYIYCNLFEKGRTFADDEMQAKREGRSGQDEPLGRGKSRLVISASMQPLNLDGRTKVREPMVVRLDANDNEQRTWHSK